MIRQFEPVVQGIANLVTEWGPKLRKLPDDVISERRNSQGRTIRQILGHLVDSASNNTHRIVHLQHRESPLRFPNYAIDGNNDRWIAIQDYQNEEWDDLINLWKYSNLHIIHIIKNIDPSKLDNEWHYNEQRLISLEEMVIDYLRHFKLHLGEIGELLNTGQKRS